MYNFTNETQGLDTFRVSEITKDTKLDTVGLGMVLNNRISGLCPVSYIQPDNKKYIRYNISSQIPLDKFFNDKVDKKRFLTVLANILEIIENAEDYMLDASMFILDKEEIYINVGTLQTYLIYYPVLSSQKEFKAAEFVKSLIVNTEFRLNENGSYVTQLINYINENSNATVGELKKFAKSLLNSSDVQSFNRQPINPAPVYENNINNNINNNISPAAPASTPQSQMQVPQPQMQASTGFAIPTQGNVQPQEPSGEKQKKGLLEKLGLKKSSGQKQEKQKAEPKPEKPKKEKKQKNIETPQGVVIPNMDNTKNGSLPIPPKPQGAPALAQPMQPQAPAMQAQQVPPYQPQMPMQMPQAQPMQPQPMQAQQVPPYQPQQPTYQPPQPPAPQGPGETTVLGAGASGETTVLGTGYNTMQRKTNPYLIRKKTGEKVEITKDTFRIGKERTYVDYCIYDNSAVSRSHADIIKRDNEFYIVDNNSLNHTFINNSQIPSSQLCRLEDYMMVTLADEPFEFRL